MSAADPADAPLRVSGSPATLRTSAPAAGDDLSPRLVDVRDEYGTALEPRTLHVVGGQVKLRLHRATPPGRYAGAIAIGGGSQLLEVEVIRTVALRIRPVPLVIDLVEGKPQQITFAVENRGNVALNIDLTGSYPLGEEIPIFPERVQPDTASEDGALAFADLFARTIGTRARRAMREVGNISLTMPDGLVIVEPGATGTVAIDVAPPGGLLPTRRYRAFIPVYTEDLELVAITGTKQQPSEGRTRAPRRGAQNANRDIEGTKRPA